MSAIFMEAEERPSGGDDYALEIGERIVRARKEHGLTQVELAELVGVSQRSMQAYENGEVVPYRKMKEIAAVLEVSTAWLLHGTESAGEDSERLARIEGQVEDLTKALRVLTRELRKRDTGG